MAGVLFCPPGGRSHTDVTSRANYELVRGRSGEMLTSKHASCDGGIFYSDATVVVCIWFVCNNLSSLLCVCNPLLKKKVVEDKEVVLVQKPPSLPVSAKQHCNLGQSAVFPTNLEHSR